MSWSVSCEPDEWSVRHSALGGNCFNCHLLCCISRMELEKWSWIKKSKQTLGLIVVWLGILLHMYRPLSGKQGAQSSRLSSKERFFLIIMNDLAEYLEMLMAFDLLLPDKSFCPVAVPPFPPGAGGPVDHLCLPGGSYWERISLLATPSANNAVCCFYSEDIVSVGEKNM